MEVVVVMALLVIVGTALLYREVVALRRRVEELERERDALGELAYTLLQPDVVVVRMDQCLN